MTSSEYERAKTDAVKLIEEYVADWRRIADDHEQREFHVAAASARGTASSLSEMIHKIRALTPTPPPDAGERKPSPPPPAGGEGGASEAYRTGEGLFLLPLERRNPPTPNRRCRFGRPHSLTQRADESTYCSGCLHEIDPPAPEPPPAPQGDDESTLRDALDRLVKAAWRKPGELVRSCFTIPPDEKRDADVILERAITELLALRANGSPR
jgi:hypothetical protein